MQTDYAPTSWGMQAAAGMAASLRQRLHAFVAPLLLQLDTKLDARLVRTFLETLQAILCLRHRAHGLLLSELGAYLSSPQQAPAATKRLSNLLRCKKWTHALLERFLWQQAQQRHQQLQAAGEETLLIWDESVLEKNESRQAEGLSPVRSSKAARCVKIKPGYYNPPTKKPIFVPGLHWICLLLLGRSGPPTVACMHWWSSRGEKKSDARTLHKNLLQRCLKAFGASVLHVFDRGYAGSPWMEALLEAKVGFVVRWPNRYYLKPLTGRAQNAWKLLRGKKAWDKRLIKDARRGTQRQIGVLAREVRHPEFETPLWLVVSRQGRGRQPWYLLTNQPVTNKEEAWAVVLGYARRWQIEMTFRYTKSELAMESPRLWEWERRIKLLLMVTLCYAFLLALLASQMEGLCRWLLRYYCHRTGKRSQQVSAPLYRLRTAISRLWLQFPAIPNLPSQNSG